MCHNTVPAEPSMFVDYVSDLLGESQALSSVSLTKIALRDGVICFGNRLTRDAVGDMVRRHSFVHNRLIAWIFSLAISYANGSVPIFAHAVELFQKVVVKRSVVDLLELQRIAAAAFVIAMKVEDEGVHRSPDECPVARYSVIAKLIGQRTTSRDLVRCEIEILSAVRFDDVARPSHLCELVHVFFAIVDACNGCGAWPDREAWIDLFIVVACHERLRDAHDDILVVVGTVVFLVHLFSSKNSVKEARAALVAASTIILCLRGTPKSELMRTIMLSVAQLSREFISSLRPTGGFDSEFDFQFLLQRYYSQGRIDHIYDIGRTLMSYVTAA